MNGKQFHKRFKKALKYVGLRWKDRHQADVNISHNWVFVEHKDRAGSFRLSGVKHANKTF